MLEFVYNLYSTDKLNSKHTLLSVCSSKQNAIQLAAYFCNFTLTNKDIKLLQSQNKTQGRGDDFTIEKIELNKL